MASRDFTINLRLDRSQAEAAARQQAAALGDLVGKAKQAGDAQEKAANQGRDALGRFTKGAGEAGTAAAAAGKSGAAGFDLMAAGAGIALVGFQALTAAARALGQGIDEAARKQDQLVKGFASERDKLRELAALEGKTLDNQYVIDFAKFQQATRSTFEEARAYRTEYLNSGAQFVGKTISEGESGQVQEQTASLAIARGLDPRIMGDLVGTLLGTKNWQQQFGDQASEQITGTAYQMLQGISRGRGDNPVLLKNVTSLMAQTLNEDKLKGIFQDPRDIVALASTMAESKPEEAEVFGRNAIKFARDFGDKKIGPLLQKAGVTPRTGFEQAYEQIGAVILAEAKAAPEGTSIQDVVARYAPDERMKVAVSTIINRGIGPGGTFADRRAFMAQFGPDQAMRDVATFQASETGLAREAEAGQRVSEAKRGAKFSPMDILRTQAATELADEGKIDTTQAEVQGFLLKGMSFGLIPDARKIEINRRVGQILSRRAQAGGVAAGMFDEAGEFGSLGRRRLDAGISNEGANATFEVAIDRLKQLEIDPFHDLTQEQRESNQHLRRLAAPGVPPAIPAGVDAGAIRD